METLITYPELIKKLQQIKEKSYIKTHRTGTTGVGKTLEDLLGISENNIPGPNASMIELKSARKNVSSMLTLFTKSPLPRRANSSLVQKFGYASAVRKEGKRLETTVTATGFNTLKGKKGFTIKIEKDRVNLVAFPDKMVGYWDKETIKNSFETKLPNLLYVKAEAKGKGINEEFWFNEAWLLSGFNFDNFLKLLRDGIIRVDIRIGQYPDGRAHDHGTGFRVFPDKLDLCFLKRERIM